MSLINPICPTNCTGDPEAVKFTPCAPELSEGEIQWVYVAGYGFAPFADVTDPAEWAANLADTGAGKIRTLHVMADLPEPTVTETEITHGDKAYTTPERVLNMTIVDLSQENYDFMRSTECNIKARIWYATENHLYGGNDGILVVLRLANVIERGMKTIGKLNGKATWISKFSPERVDNPLV